MSGSGGLTFSPIDTAVGDLAGQPAGGTTGDPVVDEAKREFQRISEFEAPSRERFIEDIKFEHGDSDNGYQWPNAIRRSRDVDAKPCLTMNIIRQHNLQITNECLQNKIEVTVVPSGGGATYEAAQVYKDVINNIQYTSQAQDAYKLARAFQVGGGIGWWRLQTQYCGTDTFDQECVIMPVKDPLSVYGDMNCKQPNASDMRKAFVFDDVPRAEFKAAYPEFIQLAGLNPLGVSSGDNDWVNRDHIRVCEYFRKVYKKDVLLSFIDPSNGRRRTVKESLLKSVDFRSYVRNDKFTKWREIWDDQIEWYLIVGDSVVDNTIWPGKYIPLIRVLGEENIVEGILDRKGHTRYMKDAQRMFNYNASSQVEVVALQTKTPWTGSAASIQEQQQYWNSANTSNYAFLPFNHKDDDGDPIPQEALPRRLDPPTPAAAFENGMQTAFNQIMMVSGQWQNQMGMMGNERTGAAIEKRQNQGDTATYHFQYNFEQALIFTGMQLVDLIGKIYDTDRIMIIQADDGSSFELQVDPTAQAAYETKRNLQGDIIKRIFNPLVGQYSVRATPGQAFGSRREETVQALTLILTQAPALTGIIGDLLLSAMDFKEAQEAAQRLRRMVPPQALGKGPTPVEQQLMQQNMTLKQFLQESLQKLGKEQLKLAGKDQMRDIDAYKAETARFKALADVLMLDQGGVQQVVEQLVQEAAQTHLTPILEANREAIQGADVGDTEGTPKVPNEPQNTLAPVPGAQQAPDGEWYLADPTRRGKYMMLRPLAQERLPRNIISNA